MAAAGRKRPSTNRSRALRREASVTRRTSETEVSVRLIVDGSGKFTGGIGVPFFEHMLNLFARHSLFDLEVRGKGDLHIDAHHTVEDTGIVLGQALKQALGDKRGIERYGAAYVPMEETLARCVLDICSRPYLSFDAGIPKAKVGDFDAELAEEFMRAFVMNSGITMHVTLLAGTNVHHIIEAIFKAVGRALAAAVTVNPRITGLFSTKGAL